MISITDLKPGKGSFTEGIEKVLRQIEHYHQASIASYRILYRGAEGLVRVHWVSRRVSR